MTVDKGFFPSGRLEMGNMGTLGNDIIDWQMAKTQNQKLRSRSLDKTCTPNEIELILEGENQLMCFWKIWAAKESAYKAWQRVAESKTVFNPSQFCCSFVGKNIVSVKIQQFKIDIYLKVTSEYIHAYIDSKNLSHQVFTKAQYFTYLNQLNSKNWIIKKSASNIPSFENKITRENLPISLSHEGRFYAVSCHSYFQKIMNS